MTNLEMLCNILGITEDMLKKVVAGKAVISYKELIGKGEVEETPEINNTQIINDLAAKEKVKSMERLFDNLFDKIEADIADFKTSINGLANLVDDKVSLIKEMSVPQTIPVAQIPIQKEQTFEELFPEEKTTDTPIISSAAERAVEEHSQLVEKEENTETDKVLESFDKAEAPNILSQWESMEKAPVNVMRDTVEHKIESTPWDVSKSSNAGSESNIKGTSDPDWMSTKW